ncbi:MAG: M23 family metallopeptidase [Chloroflexia bacterium]
MPLLIDPEGPPDDPLNWAVRPGDPVYRGQQIGFYAQVGVSTGPHIHFAASRDGRSVNPGDLFGIDTDGDGLPDTVPTGDWGTTPWRTRTPIVRQYYRPREGDNLRQVW